jgi:hypothetical protein
VHETFDKARDVPWGQVAGGMLALALLVAIVFGVKTYAVERMRRQPPQGPGAEDTLAYLDRVLKQAKETQKYVRKKKR